MAKINKEILRVILVCILSSTAIAQEYRMMRGTRHKLINTTYYLGKAYEYAYNDYYWTMACIKYYNSTFNQTSAVFAQTGYYFFKNEWAGSEVFSVVFKIDPVRQRKLLQTFSNFFFDFPRYLTLSFFFLTKFSNLFST